MTRCWVMSFACICLGSNLAIADGPFDGQWKGEAHSSFCGAAVVQYTFRISENKVAVEWRSPLGTSRAYDAVVAQDGTFTVVKHDPDGDLTGKFEGNEFRGEFPAGRN